MTEAHEYFGRTAAEWLKKSEVAAREVQAIDAEFRKRMSDGVPATFWNRVLGRDRRGTSETEVKVWARSNPARKEAVGDQQFFRDQAMVYVLAEIAEHLRYLRQQRG